MTWTRVAERAENFARYAAPASDVALRSRSGGSATWRLSSRCSRSSATCLAKLAARHDRGRDDAESALMSEGSSAGTLSSKTSSWPDPAGKCFDFVKEISAPSACSSSPARTARAPQCEQLRRAAFRRGPRGQERLRRRSRVDDPRTVLDGAIAGRAIRARAAANDRSAWSTACLRDAPRRSRFPPFGTAWVECYSVSVCTPRRALVSTTTPRSHGAA